MSGRLSSAPLAGCRILIVEDEPLIADDIAGIVQAAGGRVVGPFDNMIDALDQLFALGGLDGAIIDVGLQGDNSYPLADALRTTQVPFLFLTGTQQKDLPAQFAHTAHMLKPFTASSLVTTLLEIGVQTR